MIPRPPLRAAAARMSCLAFLTLAASLACAQADRVERGRYLVESIVACGNCHTPQGPNGPDPAKKLAGGFLTEEPPLTAYAPNITPDPDTGIGRWTDAQIVAAIRDGRRPDGSLIGPPMPFAMYRQMSDSDVQAIVAYLRTVPAVANRVPKSVYRIALPPAWGPPVGAVPDVPRTDKTAYGRYLAGPLGHCLECHSTPDAKGVPDFANGLGGGGMAFMGPWGKSVASNITPTLLKTYGDADLKKVITTGVRPDGSRLKPPMGTSYYARMAPADLDALVAYLRTLPPK